MKKVCFLAFVFGLVGIGLVAPRANADDNFYQNTRNSVAAFKSKADSNGNFKSSGVFAENNNEGNPAVLITNDIVLGVSDVNIPLGMLLFAAPMENNFPSAPVEDK